MIVTVGTILVSCKKEQPTQNRKATVTSEQAKDTGDDDEDPVIRGRVKKNSVAVNNATVVTMTYGTNVAVGSVNTDSLGQFQQQVPKGTYYFKVTPYGSTTAQVTDTVRVYSDTNVDITIN